MSDPAVVAARVEADRAKARLIAQAHAVQARIRPAAVIEQVRSEIKRSAESGAERVVTEARKRPVAVGLAAAGIAALIAAPPLVRLARGTRRRGDTGASPGHGDEDDGRQTQAQKRRARGRDR